MAIDPRVGRNSDEPSETTPLIVFAILSSPCMRGRTV